MLAIIFSISFFCGFTQNLHSHLHLTYIFLNIMYLWRYFKRGKKKECWKKIWIWIPTNIFITFYHGWNLYLRYNFHATRYITFLSNTANKQTNRQMNPTSHIHCPPADPTSPSIQLCIDLWHPFRKSVFERVITESLSNEMVWSKRLKTHRRSTRTITHFSLQAHLFHLCWTHCIRITLGMFRMDGDVACN